MCFKDHFQIYICCQIKCLCECADAHSSYELVNNKCIYYFFICWCMFVLVEPVCVWRIIYRSIFGGKLNSCLNVLMHIPVMSLWTINVDMISSFTNTCSCSLPKKKRDMYVVSMGICFLVDVTDLQVN